MKNNVYVLYNVLSKRYGDVFCSPTDEFAARQIAYMFANNSSNFIRGETELCRVGSIDIENGVVDALSAPVRIDIPNSPDIDIDKACASSQS